ncbi:hypothetical protein HYPSUDRAFT_130659 [Hypholoma sublateritium FD-334 SS-4]|uniref:IPT/TIG domain-containing protein n=1 Tax=Hypholoma sublateritium (strain FD-334 SS-4) TaxID=945553 RepID=A0A0D2LJK7_HYPSF|nr:hypothetical protein HYPSUDRAFT_130659 [Hypholoma sublateritium FD-334 SS-4]
MSAPTTATTSRSPSPLTPEPSDSLEVNIQSDLDLSSSWYNSTKMPPWASDPLVYSASHKPDEDHMLRLDDLIEQHAYDDSPSSGFPSALNFSSPPTYPSTSNSSPSNSESVTPDFRASNLIPSRHGSISITKPIPPPASLPRKHDPASMNQRVTHPPKESCFNLPIMFPSIPEGGTKSRVETQVRVTVDLADSSSSSYPSRYDRVGSWKWLKLPSGTATKKRTRKQGKIDPDPRDILHLTATISCATPPHSRVLSCSSCQAREAKRVAKKLAARVRPARSESDSDCDAGANGRKSRPHEDTTSIIQFNCAEILDFSTGSVVLPLRITCYCRHHREKVGFNVHFSMTDHTGRLVGSGTSRPIMITDDHKTSNNKPAELVGSFSPIDHSEWSQVGGMPNETSPNPDARAPSKRKKDTLPSIGSSKKRTKPYDSSAKPNRPMREESISSAPSPSTSYSPLPTTRASTPSSALHSVMTLGSNSSPSHPMMDDSETSSPDTIATPLDTNSDIQMPFDLNSQLREDHLSPSNLPDMMLPGLPHPMSFMFFDPTRRSQQTHLQLPTIHRLIPNMGPTHGGIEVTVLGANFHPTVQLNCVFGDVVASSTQRWSDNTLVCILPPRASPGIVSVWFDGFQKTDEQNIPPPSLFTYSDESDRALMELALQVVGLKMTGKIEDAKNVAMRIVGNAGSDSSDSSGNNTGMMQLSSSPLMRDLRPLLFVRGENDNFESRIIDFLVVIDAPMGTSAPHSIPTVAAISHPSPSGQTLLHLAVFLKFISLTKFLIKRGADLDARDRNGYTALHFAALSQSKECSAVLLEAGADPEIVNARGKTPEEIASPGFFRDNNLSESDNDTDRSEDEDAELGDAEEDDDVHLQQIIKQRHSRRTLRSNVHKGLSRRSANVSRAATPPPVIEDKPTNMDKKGGDCPDAAAEVDAADAKRVVSFMEKMIQRTLAQIPATQGIIPQLPLPHLPHLPNLPDLPWGALPQIPMVFPVFVPMMPNWPAFLGGEHASGDDGNKMPGEGDDVAPNMGAGAVALRAAQEWRATWEKWVALAVATTARQQTEDLPPPVYTPRAIEAEAPDASSPAPVAAATHESATLPHAAEIRPIGYNDTPLPDQVIEQFGYQPAAKQTQKLQKKRKSSAVRRGMAC